MKNKQSQKDWVKKQLLENGTISRNECLRNYISRLGAIIAVIKDEGFEFETKYQDGDYVYNLKNSPYKKVEYRVQGELVAVKYEK